MSVTERDVVYVGFDSSGNPSGINVFQAADVVPEKHGGTGVSSFDELNLTASSLTAVSAVSSLYVSALSGVNGLPYPNPFSFVRTTGAGTNSTDEQNFAIGAAVTTIESNPNHIRWDNTLKYFNVSAAGTYEILGNFVVDSGSQSDPIEITSKKNGSDVHIISPKLYGNVGPEERTFHSVLTAAAGDYITVTIHMDDGGTKTAHLEIGSNLMLKRIL